MRKVYYLSTCSTSKRIIKQVGLEEKDFEFQDIKFDPITEDQLKEMYGLSGSYESLFSRTARKYKVQGLKNKVLTEEDFKNYLLDEYTFLKRPVVIIEQQIFIGNSKKNIEQLTFAV